MAQGSKEAYTSKQKRQAQHIEKSEKASGRSSKRAAQIAWATVNKETGGAGKRVKNTSPSKKGAHKAAASTSHATRVQAGKKAARTRQQSVHLNLFFEGELPQKREEKLRAFFMGSQKASPLTISSIEGSLQDLLLSKTDQLCSL